MSSSASASASVESPMAFFASPRSLHLHSLPNRLSGARTKRILRSLSVVAGAATEKSSAIVWFKHDLRVDDHPGLLAASKYRAVVPLYIFDHRILSRYPDETLELIVFALEELRTSLKMQGSNLMIRFGQVEDVIKDLVQEVQAANVFAEEEVEYDIHKIIRVVENKLETMSFQEERPRITVWQTPFCEIENSEELPFSWEDFKKQKSLPASPFPADRLASPEREVQWGSLPTYDDLKEYMKENPCKTEGSWTGMKEESAKTILQTRLCNLYKDSLSDLEAKGLTRKKVDRSVFVTKKRDVVGGSSNDVLNALAAYLRYLEGTSRDDWQEVHARVRDAEIRDGASFYKLFGPALQLGIISRRRVHDEAIKYEKERNAGFLSPFGYSAATVAAAVDTVRSMEWYWLMALKNRSNDQGMYPVRIWRWKGYLIQYTVLGDKGPPILLVHGFGAFLEHYRDNIRGLASSGNQVWAITILGFGKSEKPNIIYTELLWAEMLRDFVIDVVGQPVHLVGNSIGGYFASLVACFWPRLVKSVILLNSAGNVIPGYSPTPNSKDRRTSGVARIGAQLLLFYLRLQARSLLKDCYPINPERADEALVDEMLRASHDPGVVVVLESIFSFDLSMPLNYLLEGLEEKVLVIQGMKDPLSNSKKKLALLSQHCPGIVTKKLDAGHCPHDELPQEVNSIISEWIINIESKLGARSSELGACQVSWLI